MIIWVGTNTVDCTGIIGGIKSQISIAVYTLQCENIFYSFQVFEHKFVCCKYKSFYLKLYVCIKKKQNFYV